MDSVLGRAFTNEEVFAIYIPELEHTAEVKLYRSSNGGTLGDGYGRFVDDASHKDKKYFFAGSYVFFSNNLSNTIAGF